LGKSMRILSCSLGQRCRYVLDSFTYNILKPVADICGENLIHHRCVDRSQPLPFYGFDSSLDQTPFHWYYYWTAEKAWVEGWSYWISQSSRTTHWSASSTVLLVYHWSFQDCTQGLSCHLFLDMISSCYR
jgi:hypothetical protein